MSIVRAAGGEPFGPTAPTEGGEPLAIRPYGGCSGTQDRAAAIQELIWALLSSSEFRFNH